MHVHSHVKTCARVGKQMDGGGGNTDHDQMDSSSWETSLVLSTRRFPALMTDLFKKCICLVTWSKGSHQAKMGFLFLDDWTCSLLGIADPGLPGRGWGTEAQLPGPAVPGARSLSTSGRGSPYLRAD